MAALSLFYKLPMSTTWLLHTLVFYFSEKHATVVLLTHFSTITRSISVAWTRDWKEPEAVSTNQSPRVENKPNANTKIDL